MRPEIDGFKGELNAVGTLVLVAAKMADSGDEFFVLGLLSNHARSFLDLRRDRVRSGLRLGSAAAAPVAAALGLAALTPATRPLLNDQRVAGLDRRQLAYHVLLRIPLGTVAWEETAFRGVLQAALRRVLAEPAATAVASAVFGIWHIRPTAEALAVNRLAADRGTRIAAVSATVAGTAAAGALLSFLRIARAAWPRR